MKYFILLFTLLFSFNSINAFDPSKLGEDLLKSAPGKLFDDLKKSIPGQETPQMPSNKNPKPSEKIDEAKSEKKIFTAEEYLSTNENHGNSYNKGLAICKSMGKPTYKPTYNCADSNNRYVRPLTLKETIDIFDKKVFLLGKPHSFNNEKIFEFMFNFDKNEVYFITGDSVLHTDKFEIAMTKKRCFDGACVSGDDFYYFYKGQEGILGGGIFNFAWQQSGRSDPGGYICVNGDLLEVNQDIFDAKNATCYDSMYVNMTSMFSNKSYGVTDNAVRLVSKDPNLFQNANLETNESKNQRIKTGEASHPTLVNLYYSYLKSYKLCVVEAEFLEKKDYKEWKDVTNKLIEISLNEGDLAVKKEFRKKSKDISWSQANNKLKNDENYQLQVRTMRGGDKAKGRKGCKNVIQDTVQILKAALPVDDKPVDRDF